MDYEPEPIPRLEYYLPPIKDPLMMEGVEEESPDQTHYESVFSEDECQQVQEASTECLDNCRHDLVSKKVLVNP